MSFDAPTSLRLIGESLGLVDRLGARPIAVRGIRMSDHTLVVEVDVASDEQVAVRAEIANVMGALSGLGIPDLFPILTVQSFGVRAIRRGTNDELLWIVSSLDAARFVAEGKPIEWLSRSLVQENTPAYRRSQADRLIGQVETALRDLIDEHARDHVGSEYVAVMWPRAVSEMRRQAETEGEDPADPRVLLDFAYLPQLREGLIAWASWFDDGCLGDVSRLESELGAMNRARRKVAHHRAVTDDDVRTCRTAALTILGAAGYAHPSLVNDFLVDRWEEEVQRVFGDVHMQVQAPTVPPVGTLSEARRRDLAVGALRVQLEGIIGGLAELDRLVVPPSRRQLHDAATAALAHWRSSLERLIEVGRQSDVTIVDATVAQQRYADALAEVRQMTDEIRAIRVNPAP